MRATLLAAALAAGVGCATLTTLPAAAAGEQVKVQYRQSSTGGDQAEPWFKVVNTGSSSLSLGQVKLRYYFKAEAGASYTFRCSWAVKGCANITGTFGTLANPTATADRYLEIGFTSGAGSLAAGADSGDLQLRFHRSDWRPLVQSDDYSFGPSQTSYGDWSKVTATVGGSQVWGTAPAG
ncbi:cellulose binding domain-containing protein, partial [Streptomyces sp. CO7]